MAKDEMIFGVHPVIEAIESGKEISKIYIQRDVKLENLTRLRKLIKQNKLPVANVPVQKLNQMTGGNHQGVLAFVSPITTYKIEDILPGVYEQGKTPLLLILDRISDVRNIGAITRTAEASGVDAVIIPTKESAALNDFAMKSSAGALNRVNICKSHNLWDTCVYLKESGLQLVAATEKGNDNLYDIEFTHPTAIIMGSEDRGISRNLLEISDFQTAIPMMGKIGSLNVSVATGVMLYEAVRQRVSNQ
ncbi:MAG TPA: 23S rRNA (guanosine(2251)-2'-O)-methyltransferase RlmB [Flavobacteriales bacterium]|nr:23S rRNA (guanosine(2251)-2'-O)-methyltransferase RlmB [Flavobacteriales bacterium]|tara:strand:- start:118541 stop:119284 length:744 start_codon:yes stop_codon:yes gene_type:complete